MYYKVKNLAIWILSSIKVGCDHLAQNCKDWLNDESVKIANWVLEAKKKVAEVSTESSLKTKLAQKYFEKAEKSKEVFKKFTDEICGRK